MALLKGETTLLNFGPVVPKPTRIRALGLVSKEQTQERKGKERNGKAGDAAQTLWARGIICEEAGIWSRQRLPGGWKQSGLRGSVVPEPPKQKQWRATVAESFVNKKNSAEKYYQNGVWVDGLRIPKNNLLLGLICLC